MAKKTDNTVLEKPTKKTTQQLILAICVLIILALSYYFNRLEFTETQISTPIIARTELNKKSNINIQVFDKKPTKEIQNKKTEIKTSEEKTKTPIIDLATVVKQITALELADEQIKTDLKSLSKKESISANTLLRLEKLENLNGTVGNLSKIFLAQQLVLLDNAFKVGGNQNLAIENVYKFAKNIAKQENVAQKLQELLNLTKQQAIITPQALLFYAQQLENIKINPIMEQKIQVNTTIVEKIKAILRSFIAVKKTDELTAEQKHWQQQIIELQKAIIFVDYVTVQNILDDKQLTKLDIKDFDNFSNLFSTYLKQQQALQAVLGAFIEGYNYAY